MSSIPAKDTIYIDVDDEITTIIDKVRVSQSKIIALVLPKRAAMLQSVVNMKLLKRSADNDKKHLVLITSEPSLLPLAANVGMYVARNLQSKPEIPELSAAARAAAEAPDDSEEAVSLDDGPKTVSPQINRHAPVGELAKGSVSPLTPEDAIDLDNTDPVKAGAAGAGAVIGGSAAADAAKKAGKSKGNKKLKVPNFSKFRMLLIFGGAALVLIVFLAWLCFSVLPKADILVETNSTAINSSIDVTLNPSAAGVSVDGGVVPASTQQVKKTLTAQADATGQKNNGTKATGTVKMTAGSCSADQPADIAVGTGLGANSQTFITQHTVTFTPAVSGKKCVWTGVDPSGSVNIAITSQGVGAANNVSSGTFSVANRSDVTATGSTSGGTDNITKIVQQSDVDSAKSKISTQDTSAVKQQLKQQLENSGFDAIDVTFNAGTPTTSNSANPGDAADNVTVTEVVTYTMLGAKKADLQQLVANSVKSQIDTSKQTITDYGIDKASFKLLNQNGTTASVSMYATAVAGPDLNVANLKKQIAGMKTGDVTSTLKSNPGVTDVNVNYSPFWVNSVPKNTSKITLTIDKPQKTTNATSNQ